MRTVAFGLAFISFARAQSPQVIATGWDSPTPARYRNECLAFRKHDFFTGTTIVPTRKHADGIRRDCRYVFHEEVWAWDDFAQELDDLRAAHAEVIASKQSAECSRDFIMVYANPGKLDWFDDAGWKEVENHWRLLARLAKQGGCRGLLFDPEPYTPPFQPFNYSRQANRNKHTFAAFAAKVRQRAAGMMRAVADEYPDCVILTYRLLCDVLPAALADGDRQALLAAETYGLMPAFVDGWLDAAPPTLTIVEGNENAYGYNDPASFERGYAQLRAKSIHLLSPANHVKFRAQVLIGHGIYLDAHVNPAGHEFFIDKKGGTPAARLEANVADALRASEGWVWIYGERGRWFTGGDPQYRSWDEVMPNASAALQRAVSPRQAAREAIATAGQPNLLSNGDFKVIDHKSAHPSEWWTWQRDDSKGTFAAANGHATVRGVKNGCFGQQIGVQPGRTYAVLVKATTTGPGAAHICIRWKDARDQWVAAAEDVFLTPDRRTEARANLRTAVQAEPGTDLRTEGKAPADRSEVKQDARASNAPLHDAAAVDDYVALVRVPANASQLVLLLGAMELAATSSIEFREANVMLCP